MQKYDDFATKSARDVLPVPITTPATKSGGAAYEFGA